MKVAPIAGGFDALAMAGKTVVKTNESAFDGGRWPRFGDGFKPFRGLPSVKSLTPKWVWVVLIRIDFG